MRILLTLLVVALAACGPKSRPADPVDNADTSDNDDDGPAAGSLEDVVGRMVVLMIGASEQMTAAPDCASRTEAMHGWLDAHRAEASEIQQQLAGFPRDEVGTAVARAAERHQEIQTRLDAAREECEGDEAFDEAYRAVDDAFEPPETDAGE